MKRRNAYLLKTLPFLLFTLFSILATAQPKLVINEVSQGTNAKEYVELLVVGTPGCGSSNCLDLRGYYIDDNNGFYASGGSVGIAQGIVRFSQDPLWQCVPFGTLIVIYNENDVNGSIPPNDLTMSDGNCRIITPSNNCALFEKNVSLPTSSNTTIPTSGFTPCGSWNSLAMSNGGDSFQTINPSNLTSAEFAVSYANNQNNTIIYFNVTMGNSVIYNANLVDNNPYNQSNWTYGAVPTFETPGSPNNAANAAWISSMNNNCTPFPVPDITAATTNATCNCNGTATITTTGGIRPYSYSWSGGITSTDSTASGLCSGSYFVTVTGANGCFDTLTVHIGNTGSLTASVNQTDVTCYGTTDGSASVVTSGGTGLSYTWNPPVSTTASASGLAPGSYTVTVSESGGCGVTSSFMIGEPAILALSITKTDVTCFNLCNGQMDVTPSGGSGTYTYSWSSGLTGSSAMNLCSGSTCVVVTDENGCMADSCMQITEPAAIVIARDSVNSTCNLPTGSATVAVSGGAGSFTYSWSQGGTSSNITSLVPGSYCVRVTDQNGCMDSTCIAVGNIPGVQIDSYTSTDPVCFSDCNGTASITASGGISPYTYSWSGIGSTGSTASSLCEGFYTVIITDASGCKDTTDISINEPSQLITTPTTPSPICIGTSVTLSTSTTGGTGAYTYSWSPSGPTVSPGTTQQFTVVATDANNCSSSPASVTVTVYDTLRISLATPPPVCPGGTVTLDATPSGGDNNYTYSWLPGGQLTQDITLSPATPGTYSVIIHDGCSSEPDTAIVEIQVNNSSVIGFSKSQQTQCLPFCVTLTDNTPGAVYSEWLVNGITKTGQSAEFCFQDSGSYDVILYVEASNGCTGQLTQQDYIIANPSPDAAFNHSPETTTILDPQITFDNVSVNADSFEWIIDDTLYYFDSFEHTFKDTGCYQVILRAYNSFGCVDTSFESVCIEDDFAFYFPNAFSPNGDGLNETFGPIGFGFAPTDYLFQVFDRWGNLVFMTTDPLKHWDGKMNGTASQEDVYVYRIKILDVLGSLHNYRGKVTLVM